MRGGRKSHIAVVFSPRMQNRQRSLLGSAQRKGDEMTIMDLISRLNDRKLTVSEANELHKLIDQQVDAEEYRLRRRSGMELLVRMLAAEQSGEIRITSTVAGEDDSLKIYYQVVKE
jgi:hypothetical protein